MRQGLAAERAVAAAGIQDDNLKSHTRLHFSPILDSFCIATLEKVILAFSCHLIPLVCLNGNRVENLKIHPIHVSQTLKKWDQPILVVPDIHLVGDEVNIQAQVPIQKISRHLWEVFAPRVVLAFLHHFLVDFVDFRNVQPHCGVHQRFRRCLWTGTFSPDVLGEGTWKQGAQTLVLAAFFGKLEVLVSDLIFSIVGCFNCFSSFQNSAKSLS